VTDLVIVGAGPAGVCAALWARTFGLDAFVLERAARVGGQLHLVRFHPLEVPGFERGEGEELARAYERQLGAAAISSRRDIEAVGLERDSDGVRVVLAGGEILRPRSVLIASGLRRRELEVPGASELLGHGVAYTARGERDRFAGAPALVVGGGDGAFANALLLRERGAPVTIVARGAVGAHADFRERVARDPGITLLEHATVEAFAGDGTLERARIRTPDGTRELSVRLAVIKIGMQPNTEWCGALEQDAAGHLRCDANGRCSIRGVWAAGDVAGPLVPSIAAAYGTAALAVADIRRTLRTNPGN
jgi:thioredoxin reductase